MGIIAEILVTRQIVAVPIPATATRFCHPEPQRRISPSRSRDPSLRLQPSLRMTIALGRYSFTNPKSHLLIRAWLAALHDRRAAQLAQPVAQPARRVLRS